MPFSFLNPALLWGSTLISVPILIHLLNRRRFRVVEWAAMEWLLQAIRQNKRRITLEQLLLLALRCLILLLLVLAVSRMVFTGSGAGRLIGARTDWVVVLDDSFTMGQTTAEGRTCFDRAVEQVLALLRKVLDAGGGDSFTVLTAARNGARIPAAARVDREYFDRLKHKLEHTAPSDLKHSPARLIARGLEALQLRQNANKALVLVTDCRLSDWRLDQAQRTALRDSLERARAGGIQVYLVDVGPESRDDYANLAVSRLRAREKSIHAGAVVQINADVRNLGPAPVKNVPVKFTVISPLGESVQPTQTLREIPAGGTATATLFYTFKTPGAYAVRAALGTDPLPADNARYFAFEVTRGIDVLLVDGEPNADRQLSETFTLEKALRPEAASTYGINPRVLRPDALDASEIERADVIVLANVAGLSRQNVKALRAFVERGGGLAIFPGDRVDPAVFNRDFFDVDGGAPRPDGKPKAPGLAPCRLRRAVGRVSTGDPEKDRFVRLSAEAVDHPMLRVIPREAAQILTGARFYRRFELDLPRDEKALQVRGVRVVARYDDPDRTPAVVERFLGKGKVLLFTSTADKAWNNWAENMVYPVLMQEMVHYLYRPSSGERNLVVGTRYARTLDVTRYDLNVVVDPPRGPALRRAAQVGAGGAVLTVAETADAGVYALKMKPREGVEPAAPGIEFFAANIDVEKSDLRRPDPETLVQNARDVGMVFGHTADQIWKTTPEEQVNLWHVLLMVVGCAMAAESFLAWKFGHHAK